MQEQDPARNTTADLVAIKRSNLVELQKWEDRRVASFTEIKKVTDSVRDDVFHIIKLANEYESAIIHVIEDRLQIEKTYSDNLFRHSAYVKGIVCGEHSPLDSIMPEGEKKKLEKKITKKTTSASASLCQSISLSSSSPQVTKVLPNMPTETMLLPLHLAEDYQAKKIKATITHLQTSLLTQMKLNKSKQDKILSTHIDQCKNDWLNLQTKMQNVAEAWKAFISANTLSDIAETKHTPYEKRSYPDLWLTERAYRTSLVVSQEAVKRLLSSLERLITIVRRLEDQRPFVVKDALATMLNAYASEATYPFGSGDGVVAGNSGERITGVLHFVPEVVSQCNMLLSALSGASANVTLRGALDVSCGVFWKELSDEKKALNSATVASSATRALNNSADESLLLSSAAKDAANVMNAPTIAFQFSDKCNQLMSILQLPSSSLALKYGTVNVPEGSIGGRIMSRWNSGVLVLTVDKCLTFFKALTDESPLWSIKLPLSHINDKKKKEGPDAALLLYVVEVRKNFLGILSTKTKITLKFNNKEDLEEWEALIRLHDSVAVGKKGAATEVAPVKQGMVQSARTLPENPLESHNSLEEYKKEIIEEPKEQSNPFSSVDAENQGGSYSPEEIPPVPEIVSTEFDPDATKLSSN